MVETQAQPLGGLEKGHVRGRGFEEFRDGLFGCMIDIDTEHEKSNVPYRTEKIHFSLKRCCFSLTTIYHWAPCWLAGEATVGLAR